MSRRVVLLSPGGRFLDALLARLVERGMKADALLLYLPAGPPRPGRARAVLRPLRALARRARRRLAWRSGGGAARVVFSGPLNGGEMIGGLRRLRPHVVVLAHCGLVAPAALETAAEGFASVHPALLPWVRGSSPFAHSLLRGVPLGCTAYRVDAGIDTGRILARRLVPVSGDETEAELRDALFSLWVEMTAELVAAARAAPLPPGAAQAERFPLARALPAEERAAVDALLRDGAPRALFERWRPLCAGGDFTLPPEIATQFVQSSR